MGIAEIMKQLRIEKGKTLEEVGNVIGVSYATISRYEHGDTVNMKRENIKKLADYFGVTPTYLLGYEQEDEDDKDELLEQLRQSPETRMLFDAAKGATAEQIKQAAEILKVLKGQK